MLVDSPRASGLAGIDSRFRGRLRQFFRIRARCEADVDDLVQDTFLRLIQHGKARQLTYTDSYIFTVAGNLLRDRARRARVRRATASIPWGAEVGEVGNMPSEDPGPERVLLGKDELRRVLDALSELTVKTRSIFILCRVEGVPQSVVAGELGISASAVEKHVAKAHSHMVKRLSR